MSSFQTGDDRGEIRVANISTGLFTKTACLIGGNVLSLATDAQGKNLWAGNDRVCLIVYCLPKM